MDVKLNLSTADVVLTAMPDFLLTITGLAKSKCFTLGLQVTDEEGVVWIASCSLMADSKGGFKLPGGTMLGVNNGPCLAHCFQGLRSGQKRKWFSHRNLAPLNCIITVSAEKDSTIDFKFYPYAHNLKITKLASPYHARLYQPENTKSDTVIICLGGSLGVPPDVAAAILASKGYPAVAAAYFNQPGLNDYLEEVPVEIVLNLQSYLLAKERFKAVALLGSSKGAELALTAASYKQFKYVVAISPSAYVFQGIGDFTDPKSSWNFAGAPLPFIKLKFMPQSYSAYVAAKMVRKPWSKLNVYRRSIVKSRNLNEARIKVEKINAPILFLSGKDDQLWPSMEMVDVMLQQLDQDKQTVDSYAFTSAGHLTFSVLPGFPYFAASNYGGNAIAMGGTTVGNTQALSRMWGRVLEFIAVNDSNVVDSVGAEEGVSVF